MSDLSKAIAKMCESCESSSDNLTVDVITATIQMLQTNSVAEVVEKLSVLRDAVAGGRADMSTLSNITGYELNDESGSSTTLNNSQTLRFELQYPIAYKEYKRGYNKAFTRKIIKNILRLYPEIPDSQLVWSDAESATSYYWDKFCKEWSTAGSNKGNGYAWVYSYDVCLLHFVDNIFNVGVTIPAEAFESMLEMYNGGGDAVVERSAIYGDVDFRCARNDGVYEIYINGIKVMSVEYDVMRRIMGDIISCNKTSSDNRRYFTSTLVRGKRVIQ